MAGRKRKPSKGRKSGDGAPNWDDFNLLERLLLACLEPGLQAPPEKRGSEAKFRINAPARDDVICLLFKVDKKEVLLVDGKRPDYMAFYADRDNCICTVIEMKGKDLGQLEYGIRQQIRPWCDRMRQEVATHLPQEFRRNLRFQALILSPFGAQAPREALKRENQAGLVILHLAHNRQFELFKYISRFNHFGETYKHEPRQHEERRNFLECTLAERALPIRRQDSFWRLHFIAGKNRQGVYLNYDLADMEKDAYAALSLNVESAKIAVREDGDRLHRKVKQGLTSLAVNFGKCEVTAITHFE